MIPDKEIVIIILTNHLKKGVNEPAERPVYDNDNVAPNIHEVNQNSG